MSGQHIGPVSRHPLAGFQHCPECKALLRDGGHVVGRHLFDCSASPPANPPGPQLCDALGLADVLHDRASACSQQELALATTLRMAEQMIRHLYALIGEQPNYDIDKRTRQIVTSTLTGVRALAEVERQHGSEHWTRAVLLIDQAIEELEL